MNIFFNILDSLCTVYAASISCISVCYLSLSIFFLRKRDCYVLQVFMSSRHCKFWPASGALYCVDTRNIMSLQIPTALLQSTQRELFCFKIAAAQGDPGMLEGLKSVSSLLAALVNRRL